MVRTLKKELLLIEANTTSSERRRFIKRSGLQRSKATLDKLSSFIHQFPDMMNSVRIKFESDRVPSSLKKTYWYIVSYIYQTADYFPTDKYGFWGYLDDAYLAGLAYRHAMAHETNQSYSSEDVDRSLQVEEWLQATRLALPKETKKLDKLFMNLLSGNKQDYHQLFAR